MATNKNVIIKISGVFLVFLVLLGCDKYVHDSKIIATINGEPIDVAEYRLAQNIPAFNKGEQQDQILERVVQVKLIQLEGVHRGLLSSASYASFMNRFNKENESRIQAIEKKQAVYGPRQYTEENYYNNEFSKLEIKLKDFLAKNIMNLSEETLRKQYERNKLNLYVIQPTIVLKELVEPMQSDPAGALERIQALYESLIAGKQMDELLNNKKSGSTKYAEEMINEDNRRQYAKYREEFFLRANELQVGQISKIIEDQGNYVILYCSSRTEGGYKTFDKVRDEVRLSVMDEQFQTYVEGLRKSADLKLKPYYYQINKVLDGQ